MVRYIEGEPYKKAQYAHIYCCVGNKPFTPSKWIMCEPTMKVPLGWDIVKAVSGDPEAARYLPELNLGSTASGIVAGNVSDVVSSARSSTSADFHKKIVEAVIIGTTTAVVTQLLLDYIRGTRWYRSKISKKKAA
jgi:ATP/ADP translocase